MQPPFAADSYRGVLVKWDPIAEEVIFYRSTWQERSPAVRGYNVARGFGPSLSPLGDVPGVTEISIWDVASTPDGGKAIAVVLSYAPQKADQAILLYGPTGVLRNVWVTYPYHHHRLAVDRLGYIYAFGHRVDSQAPAQYPLLIKYSPRGEVIGEFLSSDSFPSGSDVVETNASTGEHSFFAADSSLVLFIAPTKDFLRFDLEGRLLGRVELNSVLKRIGSSVGSSDGAEVLSLGLGGDGSLLAQLRVWRDNPAGNLVFVVAQLSPEGSSWKPLKPAGAEAFTGRFLGTAQKGKLVFLDRNVAGQPLLRRHDVAPAP